MLQLLIGIFFVLHGLVYLLYFGQSRRLFELQPGLVWPDDSWAFSRFLGVEATRMLASIACVLAAIGFVAGGTGLLLRQEWWRPLVVGYTTQRERTAGQSKIGPATDQQQPEDD